MKEWVIITLLTAGPLLWMAGGTWLKSLRRIVWPIVTGGSIGLSGVGWLTAIGVSGGLILVNSLPYGDRTPWLGKATVFTLLTVPVLIISLKAVWIVVVSAVILNLAFWATRRWGWWTHKLSEGIAGFVQAASIVLSVLIA